MEFKSLKDLIGLPAPIAPKQQLSVAPVKPPIKLPRVESSDIKRKPINRQAALIVSAAPWWAKVKESPSFHETPTIHNPDYPCPVCGEYALKVESTSKATNITCRSCGGVYNFPYEEKVVRRFIIRRVQKNPLLNEINSIVEAIGENELWQKANSPVAAIHLIKQALFSALQELEKVALLIGFDPRTTNYAGLHNQVKRRLAKIPELEAQLRDLAKVLKL